MGKDTAWIHGLQSDDIPFDLGTAEKVVAVVVNHLCLSFVEQQHDLAFRESHPFAWAGYPFLVLVLHLMVVESLPHLGCQGSTDNGFQDS